MLPLFRAQELPGLHPLVARGHSRQRGEVTGEHVQQTPDAFPGTQDNQQLAPQVRGDVRAVGQAVPQGRPQVVGSYGSGVRRHPRGPGVDWDRE